MSPNPQRVGCANLINILNTWCIQGKLDRDTDFNEFQVGKVWTILTFKATLLHIHISMKFLVVENVQVFVFARALIFFKSGVAAASPPHFFGHESKSLRSDHRHTIKTRLS